MKKRMGNKGFTLIELLLVMVISLLILAMIMLSYNVVNNANATKAARRLESVIRTARTQSMAKGTDAGLLTLTVMHGNLYAQIGDPATADMQLICNSGVTVIGRFNVDISDYAARTGTGFSNATIAFNTNGTVRQYGTPKTTMNQFQLNRGNRSFDVRLYNETGALETEMY
ncbi:MAG: prepilin-type N-terminal cleavage/methylation domain-containing protein [Lachnospiraceae bacterium]|nr:prepilin-type N-terminal cleavage/methylation domain-containing protein [Lachnospiraceae bacterium]